MPLGSGVLSQHVKCFIKSHIAELSISKPNPFFFGPLYTKLHWNLLCHFLRYLAKHKQTGPKHNLVDLVEVIGCAES